MFSMQFCIIFVAIICTVYCKVNDQYKIVETFSGQVRGILKTTLLKNVPYHSYKGIPYAKPPIGDLRFKVPEPVEPWNNVLDAFDHGKICVQPDYLFPEPFEQSEDCLTLNIYVPAEIKSDEKLAVLFSIHGGGYAEGSSNDYVYGPDFMVEKHTIVVTINYRLGVLGFLSLDTPEYSGNMGLKDQQLALKWIHSNIERFGGDNKRITIFGESAGGVCTHFHILSAESRKYFHNAVPMSGVIDNYWAMSENNNHVKLAYEIAKELGEPKNNFEELVEFLMSASAEKLSEHSIINVPNVLFEIPFTPVIERRDAIQPFLVESPAKIYETTEINIDTLFSMTSLETVDFVFMFTPLNDLLSNFNLSLPFRGLEIPQGSKAYHKLVDEVRNFYFEGNLQNDEKVKRYVELLSDVNFGYGTDKAVRTTAAKSKGNTFYCWFSVYSKLRSLEPRRADVANLTSASHGDDLFYLFRAHIIQPLYDEIIRNKDDVESKISIQTIENISNIYTNFAKYGIPSHKNDPIDQVEPVRNDKIHFIDINNKGVTAGLRPNQKAFDFWANLEQRAIALSVDLQKQSKDEL